MSIEYAMGRCWKIGDNHLPKEKPMILRDKVEELLYDLIDSRYHDAVRIGKFSANISDIVDMFEDTVQEIENDAEYLMRQAEEGEDAYDEERGHNLV